MSDDQEERESSLRNTWKAWSKFYSANSFLILVVVAICLARAYPPLGADYLQPQITATWIAVIIIFTLSGLSLKSEELTKAFTRLRFNAFVQLFNFFVVSAIVYGFTELFKSFNAITDELANGMVICACLPLTVNMCMVLTKSAGGDEAASIFNCAFGNLVGVFLSPVLILGYLGATGDVEYEQVFLKLACRVLVPIAFGQILQKTSKATVAFVKTYKPYFKQIQEWSLVYIIYTVFCKTFDKDDRDSDIAAVFQMIAYQFILLCLVMVLAWYSLRLFFGNEPKLRVMGLFGCTHKTVAMGIPLINAMYEDDENIGAYSLPLLIWHPMQLVVGTFLAPRLAAWVQKEVERLGIKDENDDELEKETKVVEKVPSETSPDVAEEAA